MSVESMNKPTPVIASADEATLARMKALSSQAPTTTVQTVPVQPVRPPTLPAIRTDFLKAAAADGAPEKEPAVKTAVTNENQKDPLAPYILPRGSNKEVNVETDANINHPEVAAAAERMRAGQRPLNQELITGLSPGANLLWTSPDQKIPQDSPEAIAIHRLLDKKIRLNTPLSEQENNDLNKNIQDLSHNIGMDEGTLRQHLLFPEKILHLVAQEQDKTTPTILDDTRYGMFDNDMKQSLRRMALQSADPADRPEYKELIRLNAHNLDMDPTQLDQRAREYIDAVKKDEHEKQAEIAQGALAEILQESLTDDASANKLTDNVVMRKNTQDLHDQVNNVGGVKSTRMTPEQIEFMVAIHEAEHHKSGKLDRNPVDSDIVRDDQKLRKEIDADMAAISAARNMNEPELADSWIRMRNIGGFTNSAPSHDTAPYIRAIEARDGRQLYIGHPGTVSSDHVDNAYRERLELLNRIDEQMAKRYAAKPGQVMSAVEDVLKKDAAETDPNKKMSPAQVAWSKEFLQDARAEGHEPDPSYQRNRAIDPKGYDQAVVTAVQSAIQAIRP
jgi:hypothetical protein